MRRYRHPWRQARFEPFEACPSRKPDFVRTRSAWPQAGNRRRQRRSAKRKAAPQPGRDNSVSASRHNLLTAPFCVSKQLVAESERTGNPILFNTLGTVFAPKHEPRRRRYGPNGHQVGLKSLFSAASTLFGLLRRPCFRIHLEGLQGSERVILGIGRGNEWFEHRIRLARIGIDRQEQRVGREPAQIDKTV